MASPNPVCILLMAAGRGVSYELEVEDGYNNLGRSILGWPWSGGVARFTGAGDIP